MINLKVLEAAQNHLDEIAVKDPILSYSYKELIAFANKTKFLSGKRVALVLPKSADYVAMVFSAIVNHFTFIPLSLIHPIKRNLEILKDVNPDYVISDMEGSIGDYLCTRVTDLCSQDSSISQSENYCAYIIYTSGSTGKPKGVMISNQGLDNVISQQVMTFALDRSNLFFYVNTVFDASISDILCSFISGSTLFIHESIKTKFKALEQYLFENKISYIDLPPSVLSHINVSNLPSLRTIVVGGEIPDFKIIQSIAKTVDVFNVYGPTECSICTSIHKCDETFNQAWIGNALDNLKYRILEGELLISGVGIASGYTDENLTRLTFIDLDGEKFYKTGDIVKQIGDNFLFIGREDSQIKYRGQLVNLEEINKIVKEIPGISDSFCYFEKEIILFVEGKKQEVISQLKEKLPNYMIPKKVLFLNKFKRNSSEKIDKNSILNQYDFYLATQAEKMIVSNDTMVKPLNKGKTLLTGATGFLGIHLLAEISPKEQLLCLVRAKTVEDAYIRIGKQAQKFNLEVNWNNVEVLLGDCKLDNLGLDSKYLDIVSRVIHCAAEVNNLKTHEQLFDSNVNTTLNIINFCQRDKLKKLEYMSTLSVFVSSEYEIPQVFNEEALSVEYRRLNSGYASTKWQAEYLVEQSRKINPNVSIYRLGLLTEPLNQNIVLNKSFLYLCFKELNEIKELPILNKDLFIDLSPINLVAKDLSNLISQGNNQTVNVSYNIKLSFEDMIYTNKPRVQTEEWFEFYRTKIISHLVSIADPTQQSRLNMNIFETTHVERFVNDKLKAASSTVINYEEIKKHYFKIWKEAV